MAKAKKQRFLGLAILLLLLGAAGYWLLHRGQESTDDAAIDAHIVALAPKVGGYVVSLNVTDNQLVKKGDVIAEIDPRDYRIALERAQAELASAQAKLSGGGKSYASTQISAPLTVSSAQAQVDAAQAESIRAAKELQRLQKLSDAARSRQELDQAVATASSARSTLADAKARLASAQIAPNTVASAAASVEDLQAMVATAKANVDQAQKNLDDTKIIAPVDGRVTERHIEYWVTANFKENQLVNIKPGQRVRIEIDAYSGVSYTGTVDSIQRGTGARFSAFPPENATGNFVKIVQRVPVKITFSAMPDAALAIGPGMSVVPTIYTR